MRVREFRAELWLPLPPDSVFPFFADAANLDSITPAWLYFHIVTPPPIAMREGTLIDYKLRVRGLPLRWRTRINAWQPPHRFVDEQLRGLYRQWIHEHTFEPRGRGTLARDAVRYAVPFDWLLHRWLVPPTSKRYLRSGRTLCETLRPYGEPRACWVINATAGCAMRRSAVIAWN